MRRGPLSAPQESMGDVVDAPRAPLCAAGVNADHAGRWASRAFGVGIVEHGGEWVGVGYEAVDDLSRPSSPVASSSSCLCT